VDEWKADITGWRLTRIASGRGSPASDWLVGLGVVGVLAINVAVFEALDTSYARWYFENGTIIGAALALVSLAIDLDDDANLIAARPANYVASWTEACGLGFLWLSDILTVRTPRHEGSATAWDSFVTMLFAVLWAALSCAYFVVVVPGQYVVMLVCGAPVRLTLATPEDMYVKRRQSDLKHDRWWLGAGLITIGGKVRKAPVTATATISSAAFFAVNALTSW
jgi:hypothetical protein